MKKVLLLAAVVAFTMTACKKDYTCECDYGTFTLTESKKSAAAAVCEGKGIGGLADENGENEEEYDNPGNCTLK